MFHTRDVRFVRLAFLGLAVVLTTLAVLPVERAEAAGNCEWQWNGCCYPSGQARLSEYRQCCDDFGNCRIETRCNTSLMCFF
jgi:hypothetical protein